MAEKRQSLDARKILRDLQEHMDSLERQLAQARKTNATLEERLARLSRSTGDAESDLLAMKTIHVRPKIILDGERRILFVNEPYILLTGYDFRDLEKKIIDEYIPELGKLVAISPALRILENLSCFFEDVPVTLRRKEKKELPMAASINVASSEGKYDGAEVFLGPHKNGLGSVLTNLFHRHQHTLTLSAHDSKYSQKGVLTHQTLITPTGNEIYEQPLFNAIIKACAGISHNTEGVAFEDVVVDLYSIQQCGAQVYRIFGNLSKLSLMRGERGLKLTLVRVDKSLAKEFIKEGFPKEYIHERK